MNPLREFESPLPHKTTTDNALSISRFSFIENYSAKRVPTNITKYKGLKLFKGARWYVEFYYLIPEGLRHLHKNSRWKRFRIFEDINRRKGEEQEQYADRLYEAVKFTLNDEDYNPFETHIKYFIKNEGTPITMVEALQFYKESIKENGLEPATLIKYERIANYLEEYLNKVGKARMLPSQVDEELITECLKFYKKSIPWGNGTYNKMLGFMSIMFNYLKKKKKIEHNPCEEIKAMRHVAYKHRYYDEKTLQAITNHLKERDPYLYIAAQFVYYAGIRSSKELINLQVHDILLDRDRIRFRGSATKGKRDDYILLDPKLKDIIIQNKIMDYPGNYHIFTYHGRPYEIPSADDFLQKKFRRVRKELKLSEDYTLYSFKHTRCVHLLMDGAQPVDIMQLFRHTDLTTTTKYIRDLGFDLNAKFTDKSRDI